MTDPHGRADVLAGGPGEPADRWRPDERYDEATEGGEEEPGVEPGVWRAVVRGVMAAETFAVTGLVLAIVPWFGLTVIGRLAAAAGMPDEPSPDGYVEQSDEVATALAGISVATAVLAVVLGVVALRRTDLSHRGTVGLAGAAVLVGLLGAALHLLVLAAGPAPGYW